MLKTFFVWSFIAFPLAIALVWIAYRARFFLIGIMGIALVISVIWGLLRLSDVLHAATDGPAESPMVHPIVERIACSSGGTGIRPAPCGG
ncbi:hypothetical protein [Arenibaculum sp.]|jgi:hypothetical protein|uniref:hypothetical protein n=1 Tax=Arenibaculum sp. TaxID=2865862 RepID=UPI002E111AD6|nr:hypothetical protein [Arenibaculum sp.]